METISGQALFADNCSFCHGADGKGNGFLAQELKRAPPDLTQLSKRTNGPFPSDHVMAVLEKGAGKTDDGDKAMPAWAKSLPTNADHAFSSTRSYNLDAISKQSKHVKDAGEERLKEKSARAALTLPPPAHTKAILDQILEKTVSYDLSI